LLLVAAVTELLQLGLRDHLRKSEASAIGRREAEHRQASHDLGVDGTESRTVAPVALSEHLHSQGDTLVELFADEQDDLDVRLGADPVPTTTPNPFPEAVTCGAKRAGRVRGRARCREMDDLGALR
jgi:hypothetical protein